MNNLEKHKGFEQYTVRDRNRCLNGMANDEVNDRLLITGKMWPYIYQIELLEN